MYIISSEIFQIFYVWSLIQICILFPNDDSIYLVPNL